MKEKCNFMTNSCSAAVRDRFVPVLNYEYTIYNVILVGTAILDWRSIQLDVTDNFGKTPCGQFVDLEMAVLVVYTIWMALHLQLVIDAMT